ncbi:MAG: hypothetical protein IKU86_05090 [Thermoguttaceae bacterium]|nr:hypothetical protein [Thermoguttaceae bacterium]
MKRLRYLFLLLLICIVFIGCKREIRQDIVEGALEALRENGLIAGAPESQERGDATFVASEPEPREQNMVTCTACRGNGRCCCCNGSGSGDTDFFCGCCGGNGVCDYCEGEGRYPENMDLVADAFNYVTKKGLCNMCRATGRCSFCGGVERPAWRGPCFACCGTNVCALCQGKKYVDVMDKGVKARE